MLFVKENLDGEDIFCDCGQCNYGHKLIRAVTIINPDFFYRVKIRPKSIKKP